MKIDRVPRVRDGADAAEPAALCKSASESGAGEHARDVASFCERLGGLGGRTLAEMIELTKDAPSLLGGVSHVRVFNEADGTELGAVRTTDGQAIDAASVITAVLYNPFVEVTAWSRTRPMPMSGQATLDLRITANTHPRQELPDYRGLQRR